MSRLLITDSLVMLNGHMIPATQVHVDIDASQSVAHVQLVMDVSLYDLKLNLKEADVKLVNDENPRVRLEPDHSITESTR
jgi:hypothetical protein